MDTAHFFKRAKNIFTEPKREFIRISNESTNPVRVFLTFVLPFLIMYAIASYVGKVVFISDMAYNVGTSVVLKRVVFIILITILSIIISSLVINEILPFFQLKKDSTQTFALISYSFTPIYIALIFAGLIPNLASVIYFVGFYTIVLFWIATSSIFNLSIEKRQKFVVVSLGLTMIVFLLVRIIIGLLFSL